ncbi:MAG: BON domain-containing protein [Cycloclasticus sp.]|jgi:osmotically-inducible protein OsmY|nr:BON domain-containing protein [Cycloclasticus sp.]MBG96317.1 BON domain-containing protein [Cycloclasticus sp.]HAI97514.1 BON domain-containing protein [Methylococcaceae bacterium]|tara:strand:- start:2657 stop:3244 length:588 start_codon:yes stop_codon:yes gene_type:complete
MFPNKTFILTTLLSIFLLSGCAAVAVGTAATGVAVVHDRRSTGTIIDDQTIELKALKILYSVDNIRINSHVNATSYNGILLLTGEAPTDSLRSDITNRLRKIPNVRKVHNEILIAAPSSLMSRSSDALITSKAKVALFELNKIKGFDPTRVKITSENGVVYLLGLLKQHEVTPVVETIRRVGGVQRVVKLFEIIN